MAYEPTEWKSGDVVTSAKLNKLEQGVKGAGVTLVVNGIITEGTPTLDKTWQEIHDADFAIIKAPLNEDGTITGYNYIASIGYDSDTQKYVLSTFGIYDGSTVEVTQYTADSPNDYPVPVL